MAVPRQNQHTHNSGRDESMIVASYQFGETKVHICDGHIAQTPEERDRIDENIANAAWACLQDAIEKSEAD